MLHSEALLVRAEEAGRRSGFLCSVATPYCQLLANTGCSALA